MLFLFSKKSVLKLRVQNFLQSPRLILPCVGLGTATFIIQASESVLSVCFNSSLARYGGDIAVGAMTILTSVMQFALLPLQGISQGAQPILSYNYGAKNVERVRKTFRVLLTVCLTYSALIWAFVMLCPRVFAGIFTPDAELIEFTGRALRIYCAVLAIFGIQRACQITFVSIGKAVCSIIVAVMRKFVLLIPLIYLMPHLVPDPTLGVYLAEPVADTLAVTFTSILFPQTVSSLTLNATIGGQTYKATLTPALASGMSYTYTVTMKKQGLTVSGCTIEDWGSGNGTSGEEISGTIPVTYNVSNLTSGSTITLTPGSTVTLSGASSSSSNAKTRAANTTPIDLTLVFEGSAKLILDNVALEGSDTRIVVKHGTANIILKGDNSISLTYSTSMAKYSSCGPISLLNEDAHVIIDGEDKDANCLTISSELERVLIGGIQDNKAGNITIKNAKLKLFPADLSYLSNSIIGNGESDESNVSCGDINILNSALSFTFSSITSELNCSLIGNGFSKKESKCGDINISNSTLVSYCNSEGNISTYAALIGMGLVNDGTSSCGKISITSDLTKDTFISNLNNNGKITQSSIEGQTPEWIGFGIIICSDSDNHNSASHNGIWYNDTQIEAPQTKNGIYYSPEPPMSMVR